MTVVRRIEYTREAAATKALDGSALWAQLEAATPAQIATWLDNNVTDLASAREVLWLIVLALRSLHR